MIRRCSTLFKTYRAIFFSHSKIDFPQFTNSYSFNSPIYSYYFSTGKSCYKLKMEKYLLDAKTELLNRNKANHLHVVIGNESCDLDSVVCALTYALYLNATNTKQNWLIVPALNIPPEHYGLQTEVSHLLAKYNVGQDKLLFKKDLDFDFWQAENKLSLTLVDHNVLTGQDTKFESSVTEVIDHHSNERPGDDYAKVKLDLVGSCATLVAEELLNNPEFVISEEVATMLFSTILVDTINKSKDAGKVTRRDENALDKLQQLYPSMDADSLYSSLMRAKFDIGHLSNIKLLEKDSKIVAGPVGTIAMSSITMAMEQLVTRSNFTEDLQSFISWQQVDASVIMTMIEADGVPTRHIAVYSTRQDFQEKIIDTLSCSSEVDLQLSDYPTQCSGLFVKLQGNVKASRKQVLPVLKKFLNKQ